VIFNILKGYNCSGKNGQDNYGHSIIGVYKNDNVDIEKMLDDKKAFEKENYNIKISIDQVSSSSPEEAKMIVKKQFFESENNDSVLTEKDFEKVLKENADVDRSRMAIDDNHSFRLGARGTHQYDVDASEFDFDPETDIYTSKKANKYGAVTSFAERKNR
jgi:hypothetical protein